MRAATTQWASRLLLATLPPVFALGVQLLLWRFINPYVWFLFYPAAFISSWLAGRLGGLWATALSVTFVWAFFVPRGHPLAPIFPSVVFIAMGYAFGAFHQRLRQVRAESKARLLAERTARENLTRAQAVAKTGSWHLDAKGDLTWTDETYRLMGVPRDRKMTFEAFLGLVHPDDRSALERAWEEALSGRPYDLEHRVMVDGAVRWIRERADLHRDAAGKLIGATGTAQDITERKEAVEALSMAHETERRLRAELEEVTRAGSAISEAVAELPKHDLSTVLHILALRAQALTQADFVAVGLGTDPTRPFDPWVTVGVDRASMAALGPAPRPVGTLGVVAREGVFLRLDDVRKHQRFQGFPKGHPEVGSFLGLPIRYRGSLVGNLFLGKRPGAAAFTEEEERLVQMLAAHAGVAIETATLYAGEALQRAWLQTIVDQMPEAVVFLDDQGNVVLQNAAARALARAPGRLSLQGRPLPFDVRFPNGAPVPAEQLPIQRAVTQGQSIVGMELALMGPSGGLVPVLVSATPVWAEGRIAGGVAVFQDIRALKELERLREEWAALIAHDLRQPVNAIALSTSMLGAPAGAPWTEAQRAAVERARSATSRLDRMIGDLLDSSRLEARRLSLDRHDAELGPLVEEVVKSFEAAKPGFSFVVHVEPGLRALVDGDRIRQVLDNLVGNAVKYGDRGTLVGVEAARSGGFIEVTVTNQGRGIPPDELPLLFSRFGRTREAKRGKAPGLGLGLYISQGLVEAHGGRMWVESTPGEITRFHFTLPASAEAVEVEPPHASL